MDTQISPQIRLIAIVGVLLALVGGGAMFMMSRSAAADQSEPLPTPVAAGLTAVDKAKETAAEAQARADKIDAETGAAAETPAAKPAATPKPKPKPLPAVAANGLPRAVASALQRHEVVVVALFTPSGTVDDLTVAEARAAAQGSGAAFVPVNVLDETQGGAFARLLGVTEPPAVLVYQSPATLAYRFDGYVDVDTVEQAAVNAGTA